MRKRFVRYPKVVMALAGVAGTSLALAQDTRPPKMPHTAVDHPEFIPPSQATFLSSCDVLIGVTSGAIAKAYPAADVGQHGVVHEQMPDGPKPLILIAESWFSWSEFHIYSLGDPN